MTSDVFSRIYRLVVLALTGSLLFVYSLLHVIALRYLVMFAAFLLAAKSS